MKSIAAMTQNLHNGLENAESPESSCSPTPLVVREAELPVPSQKRKMEVFITGLPPHRRLKLDPMPANGAQDADEEDSLFTSPEPSRRQEDEEDSLFTSPETSRRQEIVTETNEEETEQESEVGEEKPLVVGPGLGRGQKMVAEVWITGLPPHKYRGARGGAPPGEDGELEFPHVNSVKASGYGEIQRRSSLDEREMDNEQDANGVESDADDSPDPAYYDSC